MTRKIIDMTKDPRGGQFEYFRTMTDPWAGITVPVDITALSMRQLLRGAIGLPLRYAPVPVAA